MEIEFTPQLILTHGNDILVANFLLLKEAIAFVNFSVSADETRKLLFHLHKVLLVRKCLCLASFLYEQFFVELSWCKVLSIKNSNFFFVNQNEKQTFIKEKALIDGEALANIKTIKLNLWRSTNVIVVRPNGKLHSTTPSYGQERIRSIPIYWRKTFSPIKVGNYLWIDVIRSINR